MNGLETAIAVLPPELKERIAHLPPELSLTVQEIRLRAGQPISLTTGGGTWYLSAGPTAVTGRVTDAVLCRPEWLIHIFDTACECSVYAHQEELRCGYITTPAGCRIGVAGTAVQESGRIVTYRSITALCIRVAREHTDCAREIAGMLCENGRVHSALLCGEPSSGKTSLLRDLLRQLAHRHIPVALIDERGELSRNGTASGCDVLLYTPKAAGIEQAVRCLSPRALVFDELGDENEIHAVMDGLYRGVPAITSVHCRSPEQLLRRPVLRQALRGGAFEYLFFLRGHERPGMVLRSVEAEVWLHEMDRIDIADRDGTRYGIGRLAASATEGERAAAIFAVHQPSF